MDGHTLHRSVVPCFRNCWIMLSKVNRMLWEPWKRRAGTFAAPAHWQPHLLVVYPALVFLNSSIFAAFCSILLLGEQKDSLHILLDAKFGVPAPKKTYIYLPIFTMKYIILTYLTMTMIGKEKKIANYARYRPFMGVCRWSIINFVYFLS